MSDYIPDGVIVEILARLPVKSILRCTRVCKQWYSIITDPNFVTTHLERFGRTTNQILLNVYDYSSDDYNKNYQRHYYLLPDDKEFGNSCTDLVLPFKSLNDGFFGTVGTCNGLICLVEYDKLTQIAIRIWNPCIRRSVTLPVPEKRGDGESWLLGFGFDLQKNVFKVVGFTYAGLTKIMVYEVGRSEEWREIACTLPNPTHYILTISQVFLHGSLHCLAGVQPKFNNDGVQNVIIALKTSNEVFTEIALPPVVAKVELFSLEVTRLKDSLAVLSGIRSGSEICLVWLMKEYGVSDSWTNLYNIQLLKLGYRTALGVEKTVRFCCCLLQERLYRMTWKPKLVQIVEFVEVC